MRRFEVRELTAEDDPQFTQLTQLAFGIRDAETGEREWTRYGAFAPDGQLLGAAADLHHTQWWGGRRVTAADVSHVAVLGEARRLGVAKALISALLEGARERGAAVSTLFATVSALYRSVGWGAVGVRHMAEFPTAILPSHPRDPTLTVRAGTDRDRVAAGALYTAVAKTRNGLQCREVAPWGPLGYLGVGVDGLTVVEDGDEMVGYAAWNRGDGHGQGSVLTVIDLVATSLAATRELLAVLGSWNAVAPTTRFRAILSGVLANELPIRLATANRIDPIMHRAVDVTRAVAARGWPETMLATASFDLVDPIAAWNSGSWEVEIAEGEGQAGRRSGGTGIRLDAQGLVLLLTGTMTPPMLIEAGLLAVDPGADPAPLAALMAGPRPESLDHF